MSLCQCRVYTWESSRDSKAGWFKGTCLASKDVHRSAKLIASYTTGKYVLDYLFCQSAFYFIYMYFTQLPPAYLRYRKPEQHQHHHILPCHAPTRCNRSNRFEFETPTPHRKQERKGNMDQTTPPENHTGQNLRNPLLLFSFVQDKSPPTPPHLLRRTHNIALSLALPQRRIRRATPLPHSRRALAQ
jgi:hypothetical protein